MSYSITNLKQELTGALHGTTLDSILDVDGLIYRAARQVLADIDPQETKRIIPLESVYKDVYVYSLPVDLKGTKIIDIRPQVNRNSFDNMSQRYSKSFDIGKEMGKGESFNINFNSGIKTINIKNNFLQQGNVLSDFDSTTGITLSDDANNLSLDNVSYVTGSGAVKFDLDGLTNIGTLTTAITAQDLSDFLNQGNFFLWVYLPKGSDFTGITIEVGSDSTNYYTMTTAITQQNTNFQNGWNLLSFPWSGATVVGTPIITAIDYIKIDINYANAQTGVRIDSLNVRLGSIFEIVYYSKYLFSNANTGNWQETVLDDSDIINLDTESYNLLFYQLCIMAAQQQQGYNSTNFDYAFFDKAYEKAKALYRTVYKSEYQKPVEMYYNRTNNNYNQWANERFVR